MDDPVDRAKLVIAVEERYREALHEALVHYTYDEGERTEIASAVLALMLRKMYLQRGEEWLTAVLKMVLQPV